MTIKVILDVQLHISEWLLKPDLWVSVDIGRPVSVDYMPLGVVEVELPLNMPTEEEIAAYRAKMEHETLVEMRERVQAELNRLNNRLNNEFRDAYEITEQADFEGGVCGILGGR